MFKVNTKLSLCLLMLTAACAPLPEVVVEERAGLNARLIRIVQPGDTLHGIAFATGMDVNQVAAWNEINDTQKLRVGQRIRLTKPLGFVYPKPKPTVVKVERREPIKPTATEPVDEAEVASDTKNNPAVKRPRITKPDIAKSSAEFSRVVSWKWPVKGSVVGRFSLARGRQGIDIKAPLGQVVMAAGAGEVVYVGNSLKGYGNLIIIKHNDDYLSAYAHNNEILVKEGQRVAALQRIGAVGPNKERVNALHFQVRKKGKPEDPLKYLPKT